MFVDDLAKGGPNVACCGAGVFFDHEAERVGFDVVGDIDGDLEGALDEDLHVFVLLGDPLPC